MAKNNDKVDEPVLEENEEQPTEDVQVELDKYTEVEGDLKENPVLEEEVDDETTDNGEDGDGTGDDEGSEPDAGDESTDDESSEESADADDKSTSELEAEKDETGVYSSEKVVDPGEFQPKGDYTFEVTTADGRTIKINTVAEAEAFAERLDNEESLLTANQFVQFTRKFAKMDAGIDREQVQFETEKQAFETQQAQEQVRNEQVSQWSKEVNYLRTKGLLPEITAEQNASNWTDPKNAEQPAIKETLAVFKWMETENAARRAAGLAEVTSAIDAFTMMKAENQNQEEVIEKKVERSTRQAKGKMVSGGSSFTPENEQAGSIVGEGGSLRDLVTEFSASQ